MDTYTLKLSGKVDTIQPLERNEEYTIHIRGEVESITESGDNESRNYAYKFVPLLAEVIGKHGEKIGGKDKTSFSQKVRQRAWSCNQEYQDDIDFDLLYERLKVAILEQMPSLLADAREETRNFLDSYNHITG